MSFSESEEEDDDPLYSWIFSSIHSVIEACSPISDIIVNDSTNKMPIESIKYLTDLLRQIRVTLIKKTDTSMHNQIITCRNLTHSIQIEEEEEEKFISNRVIAKDFGSKCREFDRDTPRSEEELHYDSQSSAKASPFPFSVPNSVSLSLSLTLSPLARSPACSNCNGNRQTRRP